MPDDTRPLNSDMRQFLTGGSEMEARIREFDWAATPLGPPEAWPQSLKTTVRLMLTTRHPMLIFWGEASICLYNDAYSLSLGPEKHPTILGMRAIDAWPEVWTVMAPQIDLVMRGDGATWHENQLVPIIRHGGLQDVYWTYSYGPIDEPTAVTGVGGVLVVCSETTNQVLAERQRGEEVQQLRELFGQAPGFMCILRGPEHIFEFANASYLALVGNREVVGKPVADALPDITGQGFVELLDRVYQTGTSYIGLAQRITLSRSDDAELEELFLDFVYEPIRDSVGTVVGIFCEGSDVTERLRGQAELELSQARLSTALAIANLGTYEVNVRTNQVTFDDRCREIFCFEPDMAIDVDAVFARIHPDDLERVSAEARASYDNRSRLETDYRVVRPDGTLRTVASFNDVILDPAGEVQSMLGVLADITARRQAEEDRQAFLDALAHDLKTPLAGLRAQAQLLRRSVIRHGVPDAESLKDRATLFVDLADRMAALVNEFSDQSRLAMGKPIELIRQPVDLVAIVNDAIKEIRQAGAPNTIRCLHAPDEIIGNVDPSLVRRVIWNLLSNAVKYSPAGDEVEVELAIVEQDVAFTVRDAGIGIPASDVSTIFEFRRRGRNVGMIGGSGIGLAGAKRIVEQHGGTITVTSEEGRGSTFTVRLPLSMTVCAD